ncbi:MAG: FABP family protein [Hyphomicrobiaceae bacterium]
MLPIPADIFTEPTVSPNDLDNLGPLKRLAGVWQADKGVDINPKAGGPERRVFREHIRMDPIDPQTNGPQLFYGLRYHIHINTPEEKITFHDQVGYWLWEPKSHLILQSVTIPRGQVLLASGTAKPGDSKLSVSAKRGDTCYGICSNEFLDAAFRTEHYRCDITFNDDGTWSYDISTELLVKGRSEPFNHHDANTLNLVSAPTLNPLAAILGEHKT